MNLYAGIDLQSNNNVVCVLDEQDKVMFSRRLLNDLKAITAALRSCAGKLPGVAVESTYNWHWLVEGLQDAAIRVQRVNSAAVMRETRRGAIFLIDGDG